MNIPDLEALMARATGLPWKCSGWYLNDSAGAFIGEVQPLDNLLIVAAVNALPALIAEIKRLREGWEPIETAPVDGWFIASTGDGYQIVSWDRDAVGWLDDYGSEAHPTHWRPLPEPPTSQNGETL